MGRHTCDGCGRRVSVAGGIENLWTFGQDDGSAGTAMRLEFEDGSDYLLCYPCLEALPDEPTADDVDRLERVDEERSRLRAQ